jgi:hypothetical protein
MRFLRKSFAGQSVRERTAALNVIACAAAGPRSGTVAKDVAAAAGWGTWVPTGDAVVNGENKVGNAFMAPMVRRLRRRARAVIGLTGRQWSTGESDRDRPHRGAGDPHRAEPAR